MIRKIILLTRNESAAAIILFAAAALALVLSNSSLASFYSQLIDTHTQHFINDGLMAIFFLLIGMEVKRELVEGSLSTRRQAALPVIAALGGVILPALIYVGFNAGNAETMPGWAIPVATDIAFAVGILALLGKRIPASLKMLLLSLAIVDDIVAIAIIAFFYTSDLSLLFMGAAAAALCINVILNKAGVKTLTPYLLIGLCVWYFTLRSGVHATLAGVLVAFTIPLDKHGNGALEKFAHTLTPYVSLIILPLFAFANAGVSLTGLSWDVALAPVTLGIALGLFFGKQLGVFSFLWLGHKFNLCEKPADTSWPQLYGMAVLTGIGFTMSLFIGLLAFGDSLLMTEVKIAVFAASLLSVLIGYSILRISAARTRS